MPRWPPRGRTRSTTSARPTWITPLGKGSSSPTRAGSSATALNGKFDPSVRAWCKDQKLADLRGLAGQLHAVEPAETKKLSRAQVQNHLIGMWSSKAKTAAEKSAAKAVEPVAVATPSPSGTSGSTATPTAAATPKPAKSNVLGIMVPKKARFAEKQASMAAALTHLASAHAVIPDRPSAQEVSELSLAPTSAPVHGGAHAKSFYHDPEGRVWMFKPDSSGGARASSEAVAADLLHQAGLPAVPVYRRNVGGKPGSIQPIVSHSGTLDPHPSGWSQEDVDAMVRIHVASWLCGDHDGKADNMLRTPGGGIVPIDQGQAWKFVGRDRLSVDYHPNSSFGVSPPVYHQAYEAAQQGKLAKGVRIRPEAAVPVITTIEAMPEDQFRQALQPVASEGAVAKLPWYQPMRDAAKKRFSTTAPTDDQVAEAFVEAVVQRKQNLRKDFTSFFSELGFDGADLLEVA